MAQSPNPTDPTGVSLDGLVLGSNPDCSGVPRHWQWPLGPDACQGASVLGILGEYELQPARGPFSYVTGHTDPTTGREFAVLSAWNSLVIVDAHRISETGPTRYRPWYHVRLDTTNAVHRGSASYGEYVYESNSFRPSLRVTHVAVGAGPNPVITATDLPDVVLPTTGTSYRLTVDKERGHLYVPSLHGLRIYDVNGANGAAPLLLAVWRGWTWPGVTVPSFDVHLQRDGGTVRAMVSEYLSPGANHIVALDVTTLPSGSPAVDPWTPPNWSAFVASVPGNGNAHSSWMTADGDYLYSSVGDIATVVYDMRNFALYDANRVLNLNEIPPRVQQAGSSPTVDLIYPEQPMRHMGMLGLGYTGYTSAWQEGLVVYDVRPGNTDPNQILAQVDTCFSSSSHAYGGPTWNLLYPGAFSCYRAQDSGVVYVSDGDNGLFFVRLNVGHMNRFGKGTPEVVNGAPLIPRITAEHAPPRAHRFGPDPDQKVTIKDVAPGRAVMLLVATDGQLGGLPFPDPSSLCSQYMGGLVAAPIFATADPAGVAEVALPPVLPAEFRLFMQAFVFVPGATQCAASSRPTWFGLAAER